MLAAKVPAKKPTSTTPTPPATKKPTSPTPREAAPATPKKTPAKTPASKTSGGGKSNEKLEELQAQVTELNDTVETLEHERDFYFAKLRDVEILCQSYEGQELPVVDEVLKILCV